MAQIPVQGRPRSVAKDLLGEREFFIGNLLVRIHYHRDDFIDRPRAMGPPESLPRGQCPIPPLPSPRGFGSGGDRPYRGTSHIRKRTPVGPYRRPLHGSWGGPRGVGVFLFARYPCTVPRRSGQRSALDHPHGGLRTFHQKSTCLQAISFKAFLVRIWSRYPPRIWGQKTRVAHRVVRYLRFRFLPIQADTPCVGRISYRKYDKLKSWFQ